MAMITLFDFLVYEAPPTLTPDIYLPVGASSTTNDSYSKYDIKRVYNWTDFNLHTIGQSFGPVLMGARIAAEPMPTSVPPGVRNETDVKAHVVDYLRRRMRHATRAGHNQMRNTGTMGDYCAREWDLEAAARRIDRFTPDYCLINPGGDGRLAKNYLPGDAKSSFSWRGVWRDHTSQPLKDCYYNALAQVNFYMKQHGTRYGYIITDQEFVAIKRLSDNGELALSESIPWDARGTPNNPRLTIMLAMWYLGMLASHRTGWSLQ